MLRRDNSLVFLTVLSQASIGLVLCLTGLVYFSEQAEVPARVPLLIALVLVVVATTASFFHLGNPSNAPRALNNLSGSWLSREILALGAYSLFLLAALFSGWVGNGENIAKLLLIPASLTGLLLLWAMAGVYLIPTIPPWNSWHTPLSFAATTLSLGVTGSLLLIKLRQPEVTLFTGILVIILALEILTGILNQRRLTRMEPGFDVPTFSRGTYYWLFVGRMATLTAACVSMLIILAQRDLPAANELWWMYPAIAAVILQETAGRVMFYASYFKVGI